MEMYITKTNNNYNDNNDNNDNKLIEGFDGIKHTNARLIFGILLTFIIIDFIYVINS